MAQIFLSSFFSTSRADHYQPIDNAIKDLPAKLMIQEQIVGTQWIILRLR